jgi:hypothetical protein
MLKESAKTFPVWTIQGRDVDATGQDALEVADARAALDDGAGWQRGRRVAISR